MRGCACMRQSIRHRSQVGLRNGSRRLERTQAGSLRTNRPVAAMTCRSARSECRPSSGRSIRLRIPASYRVFCRQELGRQGDGMSGDATAPEQRQAPAGLPSAAFSAGKLAAGVYLN